MFDRAEKPRTDEAPVGDAVRAVEGGESPHARRIWIDLLLYPTHSLPTALAPVLVGLGLGVHDGVFAPWPVLVGFLGSWLIHVAGVFTDNHELLRRHPGVEEHPELTRAIQDGTLRLGTLRAAIGACIALALLTAPYLHRVGGSPVLVLGAIGIAASISYNGWPFAYVSRGMAEPVFLFLFGVVAVVGTYYIQIAQSHGALAAGRMIAALPVTAFVVGLPAGAIVTSVMLIDDIRDRDFDAAKGWRTGTVRWGTSWTRAEITVLVACAYAAPLLFWSVLDLDAWVLLPLVSAPLAWLTVRAVLTLRQRDALVPWTPRMAGLALLHSALLGIGLALSA